MRVATKSVIVSLVLVLVLVGKASSQQETNSSNDPFAAAQSRSEQDRLSQEDLERRERVHELTEQAAALRAEGAYERAEEMDTQIRLLCREVDPRFTRVNDLMSRASVARLDGKILDAEMYEREANRVLDELKLEDEGVETRSEREQIDIDEVSQLHAKNMELKIEIETLLIELSRLRALTLGEETIIPGNGEATLVPGSEER